MPNRAKMLKDAVIDTGRKIEDLENAVVDTGRRIEDLEARCKIEDLEAELASLPPREEDQVDGYVERVEKLGEGRKIPLASGCADARLLLCEDDRDPYLILRLLSEDGEDYINVGLNVRHLGMLADELNDK